MKATSTPHPIRPSSITDNPFGALLRLHDISKSLQKDYRDQALASQQKVFEHAMSGIEKSRQSQRTSFALQLTASIVTLVGGAISVGFSFAAPIKARFSNKTPKIKQPSDPLKAGAGPDAPSKEVISGTIDTVKKTDYQKVQARVHALTTTTQGISGAMSAGATWESKTGDLAQAAEQAKATRESQLLDLRNGLMQEHGANAREIRDSIRTVIPNRSFHA